MRKLLFILLVFNALIGKAQGSDSVSLHTGFLRDLTSYTIDYIDAIKDSLEPEIPLNDDWMIDKKLTNKFLYNNTANLTKLHKLISFTLMYQKNVVKTLSLSDTLKIETLTFFNDYTVFKKNFYNTPAIAVLAYLTEIQSLLIRNESKLLEDISQKVGLKSINNSHEKVEHELENNDKKYEFIESINQIINSQNSEFLDINSLVFYNTIDE